MNREIMVPAIGDEDGRANSPRMLDMRDFAMKMNVRAPKFRVRSIQDHEGILSVLYAPDAPLGAMDFMVNRWEDHVEYSSYHAFEGKAGVWIVYYVCGGIGRGLFDRSDKTIVYPSQVAAMGNSLLLHQSDFHIGPDESGIGFNEVVEVFRKENGWRSREAKFVPCNSPFDSANPFDI